MTSLVTTSSGLPAIAKLHELYVALEQIDTAEGATDAAAQIDVIRAALKAANAGLDVQNEAAALRLTAERKLGEVIRVMRLAGRDASPHDPTAERLPEGVTRQRSQLAQKLAQIPASDFATYLANTCSAGREVTITGAVRLAPVVAREERKSLADSYTAPPIDIQLAREFGLSTDDELAQIIVEAVQGALAEMDNRRHAFVWAKYHGIKDDGTIGDTWTFAGIAAQMGVTREVVESLYYRASHHVRGALAAEALNKLRTYMLAA